MENQNAELHPENNLKNYQKIPTTQYNNRKY